LLLAVQAQFSIVFKKVIDVFGHGVWGNVGIAPMWNTFLNGVKHRVIDRNYTAMRTHVRWSVHLSALLITWVTWGDG
jgi:hypothetical protein